MDVGAILIARLRRNIFFPTHSLVTSSDDVNPTSKEQKNSI